MWADIASPNSIIHTTSDIFQLNINLPYQLKTTIEAAKQSTIADIIKEARYSLRLTRNTSY